MTSLKKSFRIDENIWKSIQELCLKLGYVKSGKPSISALLEAIDNGSFIIDFLSHEIELDQKIIEEIKKRY